MNDPLFQIIPSHPLTYIDPDKVTLERSTIARAVATQKFGSRAVWRPAPGRKNPYVIKHAGRDIGFMFLASPVINLGVRDEFLKLPRERKGFALRKVADMSGCVGLQPLSWHWNVGKLIAMIAQSDEIAQEWHDRYGDKLEWITTTSLYGRGAQYNRVYKFLGYSKGYGHAHISDEEYARMLQWMRDNDVPIPSSRFGDGSNPRMRRIATYQRASGNKVNLHHGQKRGVYIAPAAQGSVNEIAHRWHARWGLSRYERTRNQEPPYTDGLTA